MKKLFSLIATAFLFLATPSAHAVDGCQVTLCLAGNWRNISVCVPPVEQVLRDMALGHSFPSCAMQSASMGTTGTAQLNATAQQTTQDTCPAMFQQFQTDEMVQHYVGCTYTGTVSISIGGDPWSTLYWNASGASVISYSEAAKAQLGAGNYDTTFDNELATWIANHPGNGPGGGDSGCVPTPAASCGEQR